MSPPLEVQVVHRTAGGQGAMTFAWLRGAPALPEGARADAVAWATLRQLARAEHISEAALGATSLRAVHDTGAGPIIAQFQQRVEEVDVFLSGVNIALDRRLQPVAATGSLARLLRPKSRLFGDAAQAVIRAHQEMTGAPPATISEVEPGQGGYRNFQLGPASTARARPVWFPQLGGLLPAHYVELDIGSGDTTDSRGESFVVSAEGNILFRHDLIAADVYTYRVWADKDGTFAPWDGPQGTDFTPHPTGMKDGRQPTMKPSQSVRLRNVPFSRNDPWLPPAATETRGNNVWAYADIVAPDGFNAGDVAVVPSGPNAFEYVYDGEGRPQASRETIQAITTHLFYTMNYVHDIFYDAGWDEKSFNPQQDNYGRGGIGGDPIRAEAQDHSGRNNANAYTPADGRSPRIQMFIWDTPAGRKLRVHGPMDVAGEYVVSHANFGPSSFDVTGQAVIVNDGAMPSTDGCEAPFVNAAQVSGRIAFIDRGTCSFADKVANAQRAGARGVVIVNNAPGLPPPISGMPPIAITIPTLGISQEDGNKLKARIMTGVVSLTLHSSPVDRDAALDTSIAVHEWGHVLSNRLVGNANGLSSLQGRGLGEGWSDFLALLVLARPEDARAPANANWTGVYAVGAYATGQPNAYYDGIRRYPYSTDKSKNPLTFKHIQRGVALPQMPAPVFGADGTLNHEPHNTGEVWATMLWECYVALLRDGRYTFEQATRRMRQYLVASLKLTPNAPTILEARDALLAAAAAVEPRDYALFWQAFASRGAGSAARGPARTSPDNTPVTESFVVGNDLQFLGASLDDSVSPCDSDGVLDNGEVGLLTVRIRNTGAGPLTAASVIVRSDSSALSFPDGQVANFPRIEPYQSGSTTLKVALRGAQPMSLVTWTLELRDPNLAVPRTIQATQQMMVHYDDVAESSTTDTVDARTTAWSTGGDARLDGSKVWERVFDGPDGRWHIDGNEAPSDQYLISPPLQIAATGPAGFTFRHRHRFEFQQGQYQDGGVVEVSTDNGMSWSDLGSQMISGGYNGRLYADNPALAGRPAFVGSSRNYPAEYVTTTVDLGQAYSGRTIRVRFRVATDEGTGSPGWDIDQIAFTGLRNRPFASRVADRGMCVNRPPVADAGQDQVVGPGATVKLLGSGTDPDGDPIRFRWTQVSGEMVQLDDPTAAQPSFVAPHVEETTVLTFALVVSDGKLDSAPATVRITVDPMVPPAAMDAGCACHLGRKNAPRLPALIFLAAFALLLRCRRRYSTSRG
ncbi:MAG: M36 family metallopeptidase [Myxococcota bacterium]|nr:M36 family metallopeptidase [Myxococcota bacterium]